MPLPETIPVKYTEEEAESISMRPIVRQTFRSAELVDMIVAVAGKDPQRLRQILKAGTVVFHSYRYWWQGFEADVGAVDEMLAGYPDSDPSRPFRAENCSEIILESGDPTARQALRIRREESGPRSLFRRRSFWDFLLALPRSSPPVYREYSYASRADVYAFALSPRQRASLLGAAAHLAPRPLRARLAALPAISRILFVCPRRPAA